MTLADFLAAQEAVVLTSSIAATPSAPSHRGRSRPPPSLGTDAEQQPSGPARSSGRGRAPASSFRASQREELRQALLEQQVCVGWLSSHSWGGLG